MKMEDPSNSSRHCKEQEQKKKEMRLALVVLAIIGLWFVAWTPYAIVALLGIAGRQDLITPLSSMIPALFCKTASCLDPFVYAGIVFVYHIIKILSYFIFKRAN